MKCFNAFTGETLDMPSTPTLASLRSPAKYWVISDAQLKRDLAGRTIKDVYRENRAARGVERGYVARWETGPSTSERGGGLFNATAGSPTIADEYRAWCLAHDHVPSLASIDADHPQNCHRERAPKRELQLASEHPDHVERMAA